MLLYISLTCYCIAIALGEVGQANEQSVHQPDYQQHEQYQQEKIPIDQQQHQVPVPQHQQVPIDQQQVNVPLQQQVPIDQQQVHVPQQQQVPIDQQQHQVPVPQQQQVPVPQQQQVPVPQQQQVPVPQQQQVPVPQQQQVPVPQQQQVHVPQQQQVPIDQQQVHVPQQQVPIDQQHQVPVHQQQHAAGHAHHNQHSGTFGGESINDQDHIKSHLDGQINPNAQMNEEQRRFHYYKMIDKNEDGKLDGLELLQAITHFHEGDQTRPAYTPEHLVTMIDGIIHSDDLNKDGFIDYAEFLKSQYSREAAPAKT